jgi:hypothetical protein
MTLRYRLWLVVPVAVLLACGDDSPEFDGFGPGGPDTIAVSGGTQPSYTWSRGGADTIEVVRTINFGTVVWRAVSVDFEGIQTPMIHGTTGADRAVTVTTEATLTAGIEYRVRIVRLTGSAVVTKTFTVP